MQMLDLNLSDVPMPVLNAYLIEKLRDAIITRKLKPGDRRGRSKGFSE